MWWIVAVGLVLGGLLFGLIARRVLLGRILRVAHGVLGEFDAVLERALRGPMVLWGLMLGLYAATEVAALPAAVARVAQPILIVLVVGSVSWALGGLAAALVDRTTRRLHGALPSASLIADLVRALVVGLGALVALQTLGISITPIVTALGIGGLAVALALQDTLANLFAGIHLLLARQIRPGDFVRLETGEEGYVQDVTWRYTTIRQLPNNLTVVPNAKLASAVVTNYYLPDPELAVLVPVGVSYGSDLSHVERVTVDVAREVLGEVSGGVPTFEPFIRYNAFGDSAIAFTVILRGREVVDQHLIRHEFIKRLHARYRAEAIEIPFPQRTVHLSGSDAPPPARRGTREARR